MKRLTVLLATLALFGCERPPSDVATNVYDRPIPDRRDAKAVEAIRQALKPEDKNAWRNIMTLPINRMRPPMTSTTVGEAIGRYSAFGACVTAHDVPAIKAKLGEPPEDKKAPDYEKRKDDYAAAVNKELKASDACYKLPT